MIEIHTVGVLGAGTMGAGIVQVAAEAGLGVLVHDPVDGATDRARDRIGGFLDRKVAKGQLDAKDATDALARVRHAESLEALSAADLVVEAIPEDLALKRDAFRRLDATAADGAILATNTSSLSIAAIGSVTRHPERVVGMHFFNPAPLMKLVEIVRAQRTDEDTFESAYAFAASLGKEPIRCNDTPGFVVNRILIPLLNDCVRVLDEAGVSPEDLDKAMRFGAGWPMGPTTLVDLVGIDVHVHASEALWQGLREPRMAAPARLVAMAKAGKLGRKSGEGFYRYDED
jgi:3-hydroxybutyryl-CoA dehydrogenase